MSNIILKLSNIAKEFPGVRALDNVNFELFHGEVHALLGENGAGKSTMIKILTGAHSKTSGKFIFEGKEIEHISPDISKKIGINAIYQELTVFDELTVAQNIFMGKEINGKVLTNDKKMNEEAKKIFDNMGIDINPNSLVKELSIAQKQMVEIARVLSSETKVLIMDEPTSSISKKETEILFRLINDLKESGVSIIYISHRMEELFEICDRITIMRDGKTISTLNTKDVSSEEELVNLMIDRKLDQFFPKRKVEIKEEIMRVENLTKNNVFNDISFNIRKGEILGIGGLVGSKRSEIVEAILGLRTYDSGKIYLNNEEVKFKTPSDAIENGLGLITEDRKGTGLFLQMSVKENTTMAGLKKISKFKSIIDRKKEKEILEKYIEALKIKTPHMNQVIQSLSGGNQQKAIIARWLLLQPDILIMDEPTRGIDVNAKAEIYNLMGDLVESGVSIIMISSEIPELISMSDRIMVMREGHISGFLEGEEMVENNVLKLAFGGKINEFNN
ncbi:TPA: sugar ABC transporter ATP-binding protein [Clostridioides difficile]|uniref:ABC-type transport system, ribose-specific ATP-binding protein n=2 Tax=Clostridioides difficile TaxID=1496 RepID=Q18D42_CLOD6|nr:sugar ABC transporter ATP-binding protein [Clostridioides difficile]EQF88521.1 ABC transporter family protein [Clostridioides difficile CD196]AJP09999.1 ABC-type transport system, ribose-specific ATP-binding protein [Clostridioides difficile 630]ARE61207.1 ABC-type transport system, ribose-specific ATP-binding protein [Clostridioides difficile]AXB63219.1 ribose ABC transporter ATP-binding protein [Clostridioides difficile]EGT3677526.1 sugar ABC transporter ATP-binding protein [Clostridioide